MIQLFIDLDGVLADFDGAYEARFGIRPDRHVEDPPGFWENIASVPRFFAELPLMPGALDLWNGTRELHPNPIILTGLPRSVTTTEQQKREWVRERIGIDVAVICVHSKRKAEHGKPGDILVDDWDRYRDIWERMGGVFVLHTSTNETLLRLKELL